MRQARLITCAVGVVVVLLLSGCASSISAPGGDSAARGPAPDLFRLAPIQPAAGQRATPIRVEHVSTPPSGDFGWSLDRVDPASSQLSISWTDSPDAACGRADLVQVHETRAAVVIGVQDTQLRPPVACSDVGLGHVATVRLQRPVGERALVVPVQESDITGTTAEFRAALTESPGILPKAGCGASSTPSMPVGMPDSATALAPGDPDSVTVCRYSWGEAGTVITRRSLDRPADAAALARRINQAASDLEPARARFECDEVEQTQYVAVFSGRGLLVSVSTDRPVCGEVTNGVVAARAESALARALADLFEDGVSRGAGR